MAPTQSDSGHMSDLAELIVTHKRARGWSYQQLADRSHGVIARQRWQQLATGVRMIEFPEPATLEAIAEGIDVDVTTVVVAAAASIGLPVHRTISGFAAMLPSDVDSMDPDMRDALLHVIRLASRRVNASQEPGPEAGGAELTESPAIGAQGYSDEERVHAQEVRKRANARARRNNSTTRGAG